MNINETGVVLAKIQAFDNRTVDKLVAAAWHEVLEPYALADCLDAVRDYYRRSAKWIMPAHVVEFVEEVERGRVRALGGALRLSERDEAAVLGDGGSKAFAGRMRALRQMVRSGALSAEDFNTYVEQDLSMDSYAPIKALLP